MKRSSGIPLQPFFSNLQHTQPRRRASALHRFSNSNSIVFIDRLCCYNFSNRPHKAVKFSGTRTNAYFTALVPVLTKRTRHCFFSFYYSCQLRRLSNSFRAFFAFIRTHTQIIKYKIILQPLSASFQLRRIRTLVYCRGTRRDRLSSVRISHVRSIR